MAPPVSRMVSAAAGIALLPLGSLAAAATAPALRGGSTIAGVAAKTVTYGPVRFRVPADWPVYDLRREPTRCLRLDVHAVYLGAASPTARCPARLIGRTEAVQVEPDGIAARARLALAAASAGRNAAGNLATGSLATGSLATGSLASAGADSPELSVRLGSYGVVMTAFHGAGSAGGGGTVGPRTVAGETTAQEIVASVGPSGAPARPPAATVQPPAIQPPAAQPPAQPLAASPDSPNKPTPPLAASQQTGATATLAPGIYTGLGFDACTAPSQATMTAWLASPYRSIGIYLGGAMRACADGNLSAAWVTAVSRQGWRLAPLYVGLQAPCVTQGGLGHFSRDLTVAAQQAGSAAADAVARARYFGLPSGSPLYFDLEGYDTRDTGCRSAVLAFTNAWTTSLHRLGFRSGVYSGSASGIRDMAAATLGSGFTPPDGVWMARWNGVPGVFGDPYVGDQYWANHQRLHQYRGGHNETWGGATINIDTNDNDGLVVTGGPANDQGGYGSGVSGPGAAGFATSGTWSSGAPAGLRGSMLWTYSAGATATSTATWSPTLSPGRYDVAAYVPSDHAGGHGRYLITGAASTTVVRNQGAYSNAYVPLGRFATDARGRLRVRLSNNADPLRAHTVGADAMRFTWFAPLVAGMAWRAPADFTGDGRADVAIWRPATGIWYVRGAAAVRWGVAGDVPVAGDYTGDRRADMALWRPSDGRWYVRGLRPVAWGQRGDIPVVADFTGDGRVDPAVWRVTTGEWWIRGRPVQRWGLPGDVPVAADYNGDGRAEVAIWRPATGQWYIVGRPAVSWGGPGDIPTPAKLHSRTAADIAIWRPTNGGWYSRGYAAVGWGRGGDVPVAGDISGGGLADHAVWRPDTGVWLIKDESPVAWGGPGDLPV